MARGEAQRIATLSLVITFLSMLFTESQVWEIARIVGGREQRKMWRETMGFVTKN